MVLFLVRLGVTALLVTSSLATSMLRRPKVPQMHVDFWKVDNTTVSLQRGDVNNTLKRGDVNNTASLKRLQLDFPVASTEQGKNTYLPVYVPAEEKTGATKLAKRDYAYKFSTRDLGALTYAKKHGLSRTGVQCHTANTIFDLGFYDGADSTAYLNGGYCVLGVEADPDLVAAAMQNFAPWISTGQLTMANVAIAPHGEATAWTVFYKNKCTKEWNSFIKTVGCRACQPPHAVDPNACDEVSVQAMDCSQVFGTFGVPSYLKLDIEGAESGCFQAMSRFPPGTYPPQYLSAEITQIDYIDTLHSLGYRYYKLVRQDQLQTNTASTSGPWGENALDCRTGPVWRTYGEIRQEFANALAKDLDPNDPCPGGLMPIHGTAKLAEYYMWYDVHVKLGP